MTSNHQPQGGDMPISRSRFVDFASVLAILALTATAPAMGASFDCAKAQSKTERMVCGNPKLSEIDSQMAKVYQEALAKANPEQKQQLIAEQKHWLQFTRNPCDTETCLKHAYWSRQAALEAWFEPRAPLYRHESDKAEAIKKILTTAPLYYSAGTNSDVNQFCAQMFNDLKQMKGIRFVDPIVQTQSYEDPALDRWKKNCRTKTPFHASIWCGQPEIFAIDPEFKVCHVNYGLPPFKVFELPPSATSKTKRLVLYFGESYGPMNKPAGPDGPIEAYYGGGHPGFVVFNPESCSISDIPADTDPHDVGSANYNSIIEYQGSYYALVVKKNNGGDWISVVDAGDRRLGCFWMRAK